MSTIDRVAAAAAFLLLGCGEAGSTSTHDTSTHDTSTHDTSTQDTSTDSLPDTTLPAVGIGRLVFPDDSCSATQQALLQAGYAVFESIMTDAPDELRDCLVDSVISPDEGRDAEGIMTLIADPQDTLVRCKQDACGAACAGIGIETEQIDFKIGYLESRPSANVLAGIFAHELLHNRGFNHLWGSEHGASANNNAEACVRLVAGVANEDGPGSRRSRWQGEAALAPVGGGGLPFPEATCGSGETLVGFSQATANTDETTYLSGLGLLCEATLARTVPMVGAPTSELRCEPGEVLRGIAGTSGRAPTSLRLLCAPSATPDAILERGPAVAGRAFYRLCPAEMTVTSVRGRSDVLGVRRVQVLCGAKGRAVVTRLTADVAPATSRDRQDDRCSDDGALIGIYGLGSATGIQRLGGQCRGLERLANGLHWTAATKSHVLLGVGETANADEDTVPLGAEQKCPTDETLVGLTVYREGVTVVGLRMRCSSTKDWDAGTATPVTESQLGVASGAATVLDCPARAFLVGLDLGAEKSEGSWTIDYLVPSCRTFAGP